MSNDNVVTFDTLKHERAQKFLLDFVNQINIEQSLEHLGVTIIDDDIDHQSYADYLADYLSQELELIISTIKENDPKLWSPVVENIKEQMTNVYIPTRLLLHFKFTNEFDSVTDDTVYELLTMYRADIDQRVITGFNVNYDSIVHIATSNYLYPELEGFENAPEPIQIIRPS